MIPVIWSLAGGIAGLLLLILASVLGLYDSHPNFGTTTLWLVIGPVSVVGAMVHQRRVSDRYRYVDALRTGAITTMLSTASLLIAWLIYILVIEPDFFSLIIVSVEREAMAAGNSPAIVSSRVGAASIIHSSPAFYVVSAIGPLASGIIASIVAAVGLRKKS
ncbi:MAG: DUF4199 family protein [Ignavibacteria bacterium]|nr:DUF4199 family protein [Ignavibacteria bacterium]